MKKLAGLAMVVALMASPAASNAAPGFYLPQDVPTERGALPPSGDPTKIGGKNALRGGSAPGRASGTVCTGRRGARVCRYVRNGRVTKTCVVRRGQRSCRSARASRAAQPEPVATASGRLNGGFSNPVIRAVGRFYYAEQPGRSQGWCSGTLIGRGLVLTAAHCLYDNDDSGTRIDQHPNGFYGRNQLSFVPGNTVREGRAVAPDGAWAISQTYVPTGYINNLGGLDWGFAVLAPNQAGQYPGDFTGTFPAWAGVRIQPGARLYSVGYPADGGFSTQQYAYGAWQYFCDNTWDGQSISGDSHPTLRSAFWIVYEPCEMNGGSSGGPVFVQFGDGTWNIVAVNNRGTDAQYPSGVFGHTVYKAYFDDQFAAFYDAVLAAIRGRTSSTSSLSPPATAVPRFLRD